LCEEGGEGGVEGEVGGEEKGDACGLEVVECEEVVGEVVEGGHEIREEGEEGVFKSRGGGSLWGEGVVGEGAGGFEEGADEEVGREGAEGSLEAEGGIAEGL
jgi:hypothetical protein